MTQQPGTPAEAASDPRPPGGESVDGRRLDAATRRSSDVGARERPPSAIAAVSGALRRTLHGGGALQRRVVHSALWISLSMVVVNGLQLARSIILARLLTPDTFGLMAICLIVIRGIELFSETGIRPALIHRQQDFEKASDTAFCIGVIRGIILASIVALLAPVAAWFYGQPQLTALLRMLAISLLLGGVANVQAIALEKELNFRRLALTEQIVAVGGFVVTVALAYYLRNIWALALGYVLSGLLGLVTSYALIPGRPRLRFDRQIARELLRYGRFVNGLTIVLFLTTELDNLVVGKILGMDALGHYVIAYTLANLPTTHISKVVSRVMFPAYSKLQGRPELLEKAYLGVLQVVALFAVPATVGLMVLAPDIIPVVYGPRWAPAIPALQILAIFGGVRAIGAISGYLYNAIGRPQVPFYINLAKLLVIVAAIVPATRGFGLIGASLAVTVPMVLFHFVVVWLMARHVGIGWWKNVQALARPVLTSTIMGVLIYALHGAIPQVGFAGLLLLVVVGTGSYLTMNLNMLRRIHREYWP